MAGCRRLSKFVVSRDVCCPTAAIGAQRVPAVMPHARGAGDVVRHTEEADAPGSRDARSGAQGSVTLIRGGFISGVSHNQPAQCLLARFARAIERVRWRDYCAPGVIILAIIAGAPAMECQSTTAAAQPVRYHSRCPVARRASTFQSMRAFELAKECRRRGRRTSSRVADRSSALQCCRWHAE